MSRPELPTITLTPAERELADHLVESTKWIQNHPEQVDALRQQDTQGEWIDQLRDQKPVELRVAGGWVRDKLLGLESDDIDISVSPAPLTGLKFAMLFEVYLTSIGKRDLMGKLTKIEAKPDQSKHLETATAHVCGLSVDWVQQRGHEIYTTGSRIPTVSFGTPLEDAQRRDLTINALFYNLNTRQIEDQTGCGIPDLGLAPPAPKRIRTPLEPFRTFHDDPLRVVRAVRFAARFGREFEVDEALRVAVGREEIRAALRDPKKISRERVGVELDKMLLGKNPLYALELIDQLNMHDLVFLYDKSEVYPVTGTPEDGPGPEPDTSLTLRAANILHSLLSPVQSSTAALPPRIVTALAALADADPTAYHNTVRRLYIATALLPLYQLQVPDKKKVIWLGEKVTRDGIKGTNPDQVWEVKAREASGLLSEGVHKFAHRTEEEDRAEIGLLLRHESVHKAPLVHWEVSLLWSMIVELTGANGDSATEEMIFSAYSAFVDRVLGYELETRAFLPPLLNGSAITALIPAVKNTPAMTPVSQLVVRWQLAHPERTVEQCEAWLTTEAAGEVADLVDKFRKPVQKKKQKPA